MHSTLIHSLAATAAVLSTLTSASASTVPSEALARRSTPGAGGEGTLPHNRRANFPSTNKRRHHAKLAELSKRNLSPRALLSLTGFGTLYYDINGGGTCGPANGWSSFPESNGYTMCEPWTGPKTISQRGSNRIVALPVSMMSGNLEKYCGKEVIAKYNGKTISGLIAWDGCAACDGANGIDFSSSIFGELVGVDNCGAGKVQGVTWEITDNQIWDTKGNVVGSSSGGNSNNAPAPSKSSSQWQPEPTPAEEEEKWVEPSSSKWVEPSSSKWVEPSSSKWVEPSSSKWVEPSSSKWVEPSSSSKWVEPSPSPNRQALKAVPSDNDSNSNNIASVRLPILAAAKAVEPSSSSSWAAEHVVKPASKKEEEEKKSEVTFDKSAVSKASLKSDSTSSSNSEKCNEQQGQWRCQGKALEQCVQTTGDWTWSKRVECSVELINCDTANPVCPSKAACPVRKQVKL